MLRKAVVHLLSLTPAPLKRWVYRHPAISTRLAPLLRNLMPSGETFEVTIRHGRTRGLRLEVDRTVPRYYWLREDHDRHLLDAMEARIKAGMTVADVGANIGFDTMLMSRWVGDQGKVISFDPDPANMRRLRRHCEINGLRNVQLVQKAVSDREGELRFAALGEGWSHVVHDGNGDGQAQIVVEAVRLDDFVAASRVDHIHAMKIDVEDHEVAVLRGARELLARSRPYLFIEVHSVESLLGCAEELGRSGYRIQPLDNEAVYERLLRTAADPDPEAVRQFDRGQIVCIPPTGPATDAPRR